MRRGWSYVCSTLAITLALLGVPLHAEFAYVTNNGDATISGTRSIRPPGRSRPSPIRPSLREITRARWRWILAASSSM